MKTLCALLFLSAVPALAHTTPYECIGLGAECVSAVQLSPAVTPIQVQLTSPDEVSSAKDANQSESLVLKILAGLLTLLAPLLTVLVTKAVTWLHSKEKESKLAFAGGIAGDLALAFINEAKDSLVPELKAALADGILDAVERTKLRDHLIAILKEKMPDAALKTLEAAFGAGLGSWLNLQADIAIDRMAKDAVVPS